MTREEYLSAVEEQIRCKRVRPMVRKELEEHIQDQRDAYIAAGNIGREAEELAVCQMGDPVETGRALDRIHRPRMDWLLPLMAVLLAVCGLMIQYLSFAASGEEGSPVSFFGNTLPVYGIGIALMIGISFVDYRFLERAVWPLYVVLLICAAALSDWMHYDNEQMAVYREILWTLFLVLFAVIVYRSRGEGMRGMVKNLGLLLFHCLYMSVMTNFKVYYVVAGACLIMVLAAVIRGLYGGNRERQALLFLLVFVGIPAVFILLCLLLAAFLGRMLRDVLVQKNRMGFLIGTGIAGLFCLKMVLYALENLGIMYSVFSVDMPFLSKAPHSVILHFALLGLLLAVYRNTMTAPESSGMRRRLRFKVMLETENMM